MSNSPWPVSKQVYPMPVTYIPLTTTEKVDQSTGNYSLMLLATQTALEATERKEKLISPAWAKYITTVTRTTLQGVSLPSKNKMILSRQSISLFAKNALTILLIFMRSEKTPCTLALNV